MNLLDGWKVSGNNPDKFAVEMEDLVSKTFYKRANTTELRMLIPRYETKDCCIMQVINHETVDDVSETGEIVSDVRVDRKNVNLLLLDEVKRNTGFMLADNKNAYFVSRSALPSLFSRANISGNGVFRNSFARNLFLEECLYRAGNGDRGNVHDMEMDDMNCTLVIRKEHNQQKIFFVPSEKYIPIPLTILSDTMYMLLNDSPFGKGEVKYWQINHFSSEVAILFPDLCEDVQRDEVVRNIPGILLRSSDAGQACLEVNVIAYIGNTMVVLKQIKKKHCVNITAEELFDIAVNEMDISSFGDNVKALTTRYLTNKRRKKAAKQYCADLLKKSKMSAVIGKRREVVFRQRLEEKISVSDMYSAYDMFADLCMLDSYFSEMPKTVKDELAVCCGTIFRLLVGQSDSQKKDLEAFAK